MEGSIYFVGSLKPSEVAMRCNGGYLYFGLKNLLVVAILCNELAIHILD